jgi:hypothetical protein
LEIFFEYLISLILIVILPIFRMSPFDNLYLKGLSSIFDVFNMNQLVFFEVMLFVSLSISNEFGCKVNFSSSQENSHNFSEL